MTKRHSEWTKDLREGFSKWERRHWVPIGSDAVRRGPVLVTASNTLPRHTVATYWFVVPHLDVRRFAKAWNAVQDPSHTSLDEWRRVQPVPHVAKLPAQRRYVTSQGQQLRYRDPNIKFGDPRSSP